MKKNNESRTKNEGREGESEQSRRNRHDRERKKNREYGSKQETNENERIKNVALTFRTIGTPPHQRLSHRYRFLNPQPLIQKPIILHLLTRPRRMFLLLAKPTTDDATSTFVVPALE
jgi:hypothetical protein